MLLDLALRPAVLTVLTVNVPAVLPAGLHGRHV